MMDGWMEGWALHLRPIERVRATCLHLQVLEPCAYIITMYALDWQ